MKANAALTLIAAAGLNKSDSKAQLINKLKAVIKQGTNRTAKQLFNNDGTPAYRENGDLFMYYQTYSKGFVKNAQQQLDILLNTK